MLAPFSELILLKRSVTGFYEFHGQNCYNQDQKKQDGTHSACVSHTIRFERLRKHIIPRYHRSESWSTIRQDKLSGIVLYAANNAENKEVFNLSHNRRQINAEKPADSSRTIQHGAFNYL